MGESMHDEISRKSSYWNTAYVNARLRGGFSAADYPRAAVVLAGLAPAPQCPVEADETACRLMLAAIRVSEGNVEKLALWVEVARLDPRDLLAAAEYRRELQEGTEESRQEDLAEYLVWVGGDGSQVE
jgi:hypothetical protein